VLHISTADEMPLLARHKRHATVRSDAAPPDASSDDYPRLGTYLQMNPPVRSPEHRAGIWWGVEQGVADVIGSDHAPHSREEKDKPYPQSPAGMPGVQTLVPVMLNHVAEGRLSLARFVDMTSHGPQRLFGLAGKGRIARGYDADFTIVDMKRRRPSKTIGSPRSAAGRPMPGWRFQVGRSARSCAATG
jgi:dihydroorotase